ncbi:mfs monosaccharide transporter [Moniliophthora roreri]|nr:mfs monosaccharide transporter [Moniliophthora roreri]
MKESMVEIQNSIIIAVAVQTMTSITGVNPQTITDNVVQIAWCHGQQNSPARQYLRNGWAFGQHHLCPEDKLPALQLRIVDRFGRVKLLGCGSLWLCIDSIYSAINSDNKFGKGFAILGIYMFTTVYCQSSTVFLPQFRSYTGHYVQIWESTV